MFLYEFSMNNFIPNKLPNLNYKGAFRTCQFFTCSLGCFTFVKMEEENLLCGGESSGGFKLRGKINGKYGIQAGLFY